MIKKNIKKIFIALAVIFVFLPGLALADNEAKTFDSIGLMATGGWTMEDPLTIVGSVIGIVLSFVGLIFLILIIYAGFTLIFANGEENKVTSARKIITSAVVGLVITLAAYGIAYVVFANINPGTTGSGSDGACSGRCVDDCDPDEQDQGMGPCDIPGLHCCVKATQTGGDCAKMKGSCQVDDGFFGNIVCGGQDGNNLGKIDCPANYHCCK